MRQRTYGISSCTSRGSAVSLSEAEADGGCDTDVQARLDRYAASLAGTFPRKALAVLDKMLSLVDRNVNLKLAATDMVDRLYNLL